MADDKVSKTKLLVSLKNEIVELKLSDENKTQQLEKFAKKFQLLGPVIEGIKTDFAGEISKLREELEVERQTKGKIMTWIKDHLGPNLELIDAKFDESRVQWFGQVKSALTEEVKKLQDTHDEDVRKLKESHSEDMRKLFERVTTVVDAERTKLMSKLVEIEDHFNSDVTNLKGDFQKSTQDTKDHVSAERLKFEHKIAAERDEERTYWSGKIDSKIETLFVEEKARAKMEIGEFRDETKIWLVSEVQKLGMETQTSADNTLAVVKAEARMQWEDALNQANLQNLTTFKERLADIRADERVYFEKEKETFREEERKIRDSARVRLTEAIDFLQSEALKSFGELAKAQAEEANGEPKGEEDEMDMLGKALQTQQSKRQNSRTVGFLSDQKEGFLKKFEDDDEHRRAEQDKKDTEAREKALRKEKKERERIAELELAAKERRKRDKEDKDAKEAQEKKDREEREKRLAHERENLAKEKEKLELARKAKEEDDKKYLERLENIKKQREEEERKELERIEAIKKRRDEDEKKELQRIEELRRKRAEEERKEQEEREAEKERSKTEKKEKREKEERDRREKEREKDERERKEEAARRDREEKEEKARKDRDEKDRRDAKDKEKERERQDRERRDREEQERREEKERKEEKARKEKEKEREREQKEKEKEKKEREKRDKEDADRKEKEEKERKEREKREQEERDKKPKGPIPRKFIQDDSEEEDNWDDSDNEEKRADKKEEKIERNAPTGALYDESDAQEPEQKDVFDNESDKSEENWDDDDDDDKKEQAKKDKIKKEKEQKLQRDKEEKEQKMKRDREERERQKKEADEKAKKDKLDKAKREKEAQEEREKEEKEGKEREKEKKAEKDNKFKKEKEQEKEREKEKEKEKEKEAEKKPAAKSFTAPAKETEGECDISDADIATAWEEVRADTSETDWMLLGYGASKKTLQLYGSGSGGLTELLDGLKNEVQYGYLRVGYGENNRAKFVFIVYVPDGLSGMAKAKANMHKPFVDAFLKYYHVQVNISTPEEVTDDIIQAKLKAAAGVHYGVGKGGGVSGGGENFGGIKDNAKKFYLQTETKGNLGGGGKGITYAKSALPTVTPVNLTGRAGITEKYIKTDLKNEAPVKKSVPSQKKGGRKDDSDEDESPARSVESESSSDSEPETKPVFAKPSALRAAGGKPDKAVHFDEKPEKPVEKVEKVEKIEKPVEKPAEKVVEKPADKAANKANNKELLTSFQKKDPKPKAAAAPKNDNPIFAKNSLFDSDDEDDELFKK